MNKLRPSKEMLKFIVEYREETNDINKERQKLKQKKKAIEKAIIGIGCALKDAQDEILSIEKYLDTENTRNENYAFEKEFGIIYSTFDFYSPYTKDEIDKIKKDEGEEADI